MSSQKWEPPGWATLPTMAVRLEVHRGGQILQTHDLSKKKSFVLGRQAGIADILVPDDAVSRQHAALVHRGAALYVIDLKSAAGVSVDGKRIAPNDATPLKEGATIALGAAPLSYIIRGLAAPAAPSTAAPTAAAAQPAAPPQPPASWQPPSWAAAPSRPVSFHLEEGGKRVQTLDLSRHASYVLGRSSATAKIVVPHESVSRQHAAFVHGTPPGVFDAVAMAQGELPIRIIDLGSAKGTFIDLGSGWVAVKPNTPTLLPPGCRVRLGDCPTRIVRPAAAASSAALPPPPPPGAAAATAPIGPAGPPMPPPSSSTAAADEPATEEPAGAEEEPKAAAEPVPEGPKLKNDDFRAALLPFLSKKVEMEKPGGGGGDGEKPRKKRKGNEDSDDEAEPPPPLSLGKEDAAGGGGGGGGGAGMLLLRKVKTDPDESKKKKKGGGPKIKF